MGKTSAPYSQVVLLRKPSWGIEVLAGGCLGLKEKEKLTVTDHKQVDSKNSESLPDPIVGILELHLHNSRIDFN